MNILSDLLHIATGFISATHDVFKDEYKTARGKPGAIHPIIGTVFVILMIACGIWVFAMISANCESAGVGVAAFIGGIFLIPLIIIFIGADKKSEAFELLWAILTFSIPIVFLGSLTNGDWEGTLVGLLVIALWFGAKNATKNAAAEEAAKAAKEAREQLRRALSDPDTSPVDVRCVVPLLKYMVTPGFPMRPGRFARWLRYPEFRSLATRRFALLGSLTRADIFDVMRFVWNTPGIMPDEDKREKLIIWGLREAGGPKWRPRLSVPGPYRINPP